MQNVHGVLMWDGRRDGVLLDPQRSFRVAGDEVAVPLRLIRSQGLVAGATVTGSAQPGRGGGVLVDVATICGLPPETFRARRLFADLTPVDPNRRFDLSASGHLSMRIMDLMAPIGRGARGLIVAPPKAGKTTFLLHVAEGVRASEPDARIVVLLIDERPEEVTHFRRAVDAEVLASSSDLPTAEHVALAEVMLAHIQVELECGRHVVVLVDSLTRLVRAFNLRGTGRSQSLSGGLEAGALEIPRRFFGLARNIEGGGSVTMLATVLVGTGSRMDQVIFEEFKSTGNSEVVLDRTLAEAGVFPAIDLMASGTRREELLYPPDDVRRLARLRQALGRRPPRAALTALLTLMNRFSGNAELLAAISPD